MMPYFTTSTVLQSPTTFLPLLKRLEEHSFETICSALTNLRLIYSLSPIPSAKVHRAKLSNKGSYTKDAVIDSGYASAEDDDLEEWHIRKSTDGNVYKDDEPLINDECEASEILRADAFERTFTVKWLTAFIARADLWVEMGETEVEIENRGLMIDEAASLLAECAGSEESCPAVTRRFTFSTKRDSTGVEVELNDAPLNSDDHTSVGLQSWASSVVLAQRMCVDSEAFYSSIPSLEHARILELGAGTGLLSIAAAKLLPATTRIIATDYHSAVLSNLHSNVATNFPSHPSRITVQTLDWQFPTSASPLDQPFDMILAADVIYHADHARWIYNCAEQYLARPHGIMWLIIPWRCVGRHENIGGTVPSVFGFAKEFVSAPGNTLSLRILSEEELQRQDGVGRADEGGYSLFRIGWAA